MKEYFIQPDLDPFKNSADSMIFPADASIQTMEKYAQQFVNYDQFPNPKNAIIFLRAPHVRNGFDNSCSECSAEVIMRYWHVRNWNQFRMHREGYLTFEGKIAEGDRGLAKLFKSGRFTTLNNKGFQFHVKDVRLKSFDDLIIWLKRKIPIIVRIYTNKERGDQHTQVLIGYSKSSVFLNDNDVHYTNPPHWIETGMDHFLEEWAGKCLIIYPNNYKW